MKYILLITSIIFQLLVTSCKKKDDMPMAPVITFKSISHESVEQFNNSVVITFSYEDEQGDLGEMDPDNYSVRVKDARLTDFDWFHVPPMTPDNQVLHIKGDFAIELDPVFLLGIGTEEYTRFSIELKDRAGNWSNTITTPNVLIVDSL